MIIVRMLAIFSFLFLKVPFVFADAADTRFMPATSDSRIKTYIYNENEVYLLVLHYGFQSYIEFENNEVIDTITTGESYAWKMNRVGNKLFIKPLEYNMHTNMTVITNKRTYQFDIISKELEYGNEKDLVYALKFYYPKN